MIKMHAIPQNKCNLSVVIITRNEEEMIRDCIESVIEALEYAKKEGIIKNSEVILSDSASTDRTISIALEYPIKIVQLHENWPLSAAAGLYIGYLQASGKYIYFLGGDMILDRNWFVNAIPYLNDEKVAAVTGVEEEFLDDNTVIGRKMKESVKLDMPVGEVDMVLTSVFKREVLNKVGPHNPYLKGGEDRDISYRIRAAGYKLLRINKPSVVHYWAKKSGKLTVWRMLKSSYAWSKGDGQAARSNIKNRDILIQHLRRYISTSFTKAYFETFLTISFFYMNVLTFLLPNKSYIPIFFTIFFDIIIFGLAATHIFIRYKGKKWKEFVFSFHVVAYVFLRHLGFLIGFLKWPKNPSSYPTDVKIIKI